jgi:RNA methyltransferase, TrmH family
MGASYACGSVPAPDDAARETGVVDRVRAARHDATRVLLEGVHALKHAVRFGAAVDLVLTPDAAALERLLAELAPDVSLPASTIEVPPATWRAAAGRELPSPALAVARRPREPDGGTVDRLLAPGRGRVVVLEQPRHLGNLGAAVRVSAAADAAGVVVVGDADPWHPTAVRAAAGLQLALPVARCGHLPATRRLVVAVAPASDLAPGGGPARGGPAGGGPAGGAPAEGGPAGGAPGRRLGRRLGLGEVPADAVLLFGTERSGLSEDLRARADATVGIPMRPGVSSLNLATAVAVLLYAG